MKKSGINTQFINTNNFVDSVNDSNFSSDSAIAQISDKIRYYSGNFWNNSKNAATKYSKFKMFDVELSSDGEVITLTADKGKFTSDFFDENNIIRRDYSKNVWRSFISRTVPSEDEVFFDHYSLVSKPVNVAEGNGSTDPNLNYLNREFIYNFYNANFESLVTNPIFNVLSIPSAYFVYSDNNASSRTPEENLFLSLGGYVPSSLVENLSTTTDYNESVGAYYDAFVNAYNNPDAQLAVRKVLNIQDFNITKTKAEVFNKIKGRFIPFPFYVYMELGNQSSKVNDFIHVLDDQLGDLSSNLLDFVQRSSANNKINFITTNGKLKEEQVTQYDLKNWILFNTNPQNTIGTYASPENSVRFSNLIQYIARNLKTKRREYDKFMTDSCHQEVLFYKIEKRQFKTSQDPIQTYYINPTRSEVIKFFDSQVKYGVEYFYKVSAYTLVVGNKYSYKNYYSNDIELERDIANGVFKLKVDNAADYRILDISIAEFSGVIHEPPQTKPKASFDFNNNRLFVTLQQSALQEEEQFQIIENKDFDIFESIRKSQDNYNSLNIKAYANTGDTKTLEIYKIASKPNNYVSFQNKRYRTVSMTKNQSMLYDTILPNKKYYYLFRYLNQHGIPSNVSDIYEIFLMDEDGLQTLQVNKVDLTTEQKLKDHKELGRYLLVRPSVIQLQPQLSTVENVQDVVLGPKEDTVWGKRFMLKITSKSTGREIKLRFGVGLERKQN